MSTTLKWLLLPWNIHSVEVANVNASLEDIVYIFSAMDEIYCRSPDMQMLLNLLVETEGIWAAILILSLFDGKFKNEFKVKIG